MRLRGQHMVRRRGQTGREMRGAAHYRQFEGALKEHDDTFKDRAQNRGTSSRLLYVYVTNYCKR